MQGPCPEPGDTVVKPSAGASLAWRFFFLCGALLAATPGNVMAMPLPELWQAAQRHAPALRAAQAARQAGQSQAEQARALWRPDIVVGARAGYADTRSSVRGARFSAPGFGSADNARFDTDIGNARSGNWNVTLTQPLYDPQRGVRQKLLEISADSAGLQWQAARQDLMLQLAEAYFGLALAERTLWVLREQQASVARILTETRDRFEIGELPVTDTHEAQARNDAMRAQVLAAETELDLRQTALADLTGTRLPPGVARLPQALRLPAYDQPIETWQAQALRHNPHLLLMEQQEAAATQEAGRHGRLAQARLDFVAQVGGEHLHGDGRNASAASHNRQAWAGVQFSMPISISGVRAAKEREALHRIEQASANREHVRQQLHLRIRSAWLGLTNGSARLQALHAAARADQARLDATRLGQRIGDRTTLDLLNAENAHAASLLALEEVRVQLLLHHLQLDALAGRLDEATLQWAWQQTPAPPPPAAGSRKSQN